MADLTSAPSHNEPLQHAIIDNSVKLARDSEGMLGQGMLGQGLSFEPGKDGLPLGQPPPSPHESLIPPFHNLGFELLQHEYIGNSVKLKNFQNPEGISGKDFNFEANQNKLSFGQIVAISGDFYGNYTVGLGDVDQLSDNWYIQPARSVGLAYLLVVKLVNDEEGYLGPLIKLMEEQKEKKEKLDDVSSNAQDSAEAYNEIASQYNEMYVNITKTKGDKYGACQRIALCNWDNFGKNAIKAYSATHRKALEVAKEAKTSIEHAKMTYKAALDTAKKVHQDAVNEISKKLRTTAGDNEIPSFDETKKCLNDLQTAHEQNINSARVDYEAAINQALDKMYLFEAFSQHYLSVLFLAGHLRTPRRKLHSVQYGEEIYPMDRCAQAMHDEDNANGLWVINKAGDAWWVYGDQQLYDGTGDRNFEIAKAAAQASVDEIWETHISGEIPLLFKALDKVPILDLLNSLHNHVPLFLSDPRTDLVFYHRDLDFADGTQIKAVRSFGDSRSDSVFNQLYTQIENNNRLSLSTKPFQISDVIWHIRATPKALIVNWYCSRLSPADPLGPWIIRHQSIVPYDFPKNLNVIYAEHVGSNGYCFVIAQVHEKDNRRSRFYCYRIHVGPSKYAVPSIQTFMDHTSNECPEIIAHGKTPYTFMAFYWRRTETDTKVDTEVEVYHISDEPTNAGMIKTREYKFSYLLRFMLFYRIKSDGREGHDYICCYRCDPESNEATWIFCRPPLKTSGKDSDLPRSHPATIKEVLELSAEALLPLEHEDKPWLVRLFYDQSYTPKKIRIDALRFDLTKSQGEVERKDFSKQELDTEAWSELSDSYPITEWFTADVSLKHKRVHDLIAVLRPFKRDLIRVVVFPNKGDSTKPSFDNPIISNIQCPLQITEYVLRVEQVNTRFGSNSGFLILFHNDGVLGAQYLLPVRGSYEYGLGGHVSAIAGASLGRMLPTSWLMGEEEGQRIGCSTLGVIKGRLNPPGDGVYKYFVGRDISDGLLDDCAELYNDNYGVWSALTKMSGQSPEIDGDYLKAQYLSSEDSTLLVTCREGASLSGYVFATFWKYDGGVVCWVTLLVVGKSYRRRNIATYLVQMLQHHPLFEGVTTVGIASYHPAACQAVAKLKDLHVGSVDAKFIQDNTQKILAATPIPRLKKRALHGSLFEDDCVTNAVSLINTQFYVNQSQALETLDNYKKEKQWCLGDLFEGHEYVLVLKL